MSAAVADRLRTTFRRQGLLAGLTIAITIAAWPVRLAPAQTGLDPSWAIALHVSIWDHLQYGVDFVMTYGPLGFLGYPRPVLGGTSTLAFAAYLTLELGLIATLLALARNALPLWAAAIVALVAGRLIVVLPFWESMQALVFIFAARAVLEPPTGRGWRVAVIAGVVSAVAVLGKLNVGVFVAAMAFVVVATTAISWRRSIGVFFGSAAIAFAGLWTATGQSLGNVLAYASSELEVISRYSQAMATDRDPALHWIYIGYGFVALGVLALAVAAWQRTANRRLLSGAGLAGLVALLLFAEWKTAFTRTYPSYAFSTLLIAAFAFAPRREQAQGERAQGERPSLTWLGVATAAAVALAAVTAMPPSTLIDVPSSARAFAVQAADAALPGRFERAAQQTRTSLLEALALPPDVSSALAGQTVHIEPWETSVAYAVEGVRWTPLPLFQAYIVWSSAMDERNAAVLQGPNAPTLILREALFHGRLPA